MPGVFLITVNEADDTCWKVPLVSPCSETSTAPIWDFYPILSPYASERDNLLKTRHFVVATKGQLIALTQASFRFVSYFKKATRYSHARKHTKRVLSRNSVRRACFVPCRQELRVLYDFATCSVNTYLLLGHSRFLINLLALKWFAKRLVNMVAHAEHADLFWQKPSKCCSILPRLHDRTFSSQAIRKPGTVFSFFLMRRL